MKIKTNKKLNLPQLIEYIFNNDLRHKWKDSDNTSAYVQVYDDGELVVEKATKDSIFTVEVEEEITGEYTTLTKEYLLEENEKLNQQISKLASENYQFQNALINQQMIEDEIYEYIDSLKNELFKIYMKQ